MNDTGPRDGEIVRGGRNLYGLRLGIVMLQSRFPRIPGDVGNASTWPFPVSYQVVRDASPETVVRHLGQAGLFDAFAAAALELQAAGVSLVTTSCGFLVLYQEQMQARLSVPFLSSSLLQVPWVQSVLPPGKRVGIITIERASLTRRHLAAAGIGADVPVVGMEEAGDHFRSAIMCDAATLDVARARAEHVTAARLMLERHPDVAAFALECTNMPPYAAAIQEATGLPVYDFTTFISWAAAAYGRRAFAGSM